MSNCFFSTLKWKIKHSHNLLTAALAGSGPRLCLYVHHTDSKRAFAYDRESHIGRLDKGLNEASARGWTVASMKDDWKTTYPAETKK